MKYKPGDKLVRKDKHTNSVFWRGLCVEHKFDKFDSLVFHSYDRDSKEGAYIKTKNEGSKPFFVDLSRMHPAITKNLEDYM